MDKLTLKVAIVKDEREFSPKHEIYEMHFDSMMMQFINYNTGLAVSNRKCFETVEITSRSLKEPPDDEAFPGPYKEDLIFYISEFSDVFHNEFSKEIESKIKKEAPTLSSLLLKDCHSGCESYFIKGTTLICQMPLFLIERDILKNYIEEKLPVLFCAAKEMKTLNLSDDDLTINKISRDAKKPSKSKVLLANPAFRDRTSRYPMISVNEAVHIVLEETESMEKVTKPSRGSYGFVLAENVVAPEPYPAFPASVKDGYAVIANDPAFTEEPCILNVIGCATTGFRPNILVTPGTCARVSTGGVIPDGADAVIQVEDTCVHSFEEDEVSIKVVKKPKLHQDIRAVGSDVTEGEILLPAGKKIAATEIGIMSICGVKNVTVYQKPLVAVMSTGDEVVEPECSVSPGCIRDSNKRTLCHMLLENLVPFIDVGIARDDPDDVKSHLMFALSRADVIISTGGVSMGEKDVLKQVLIEDFEATVHFGRVHMKPGKPTTFSTVKFQGKKKLIFSLPGNPVSACVCFQLFVIPCIKKLMGFSSVEHKTIKVKLGFDLKLDERPEFYRVMFSCGEDGVFVAHSTGSQQSSRLLSMLNVEGFLVLPPKTDDKTMLLAGTLVDAIHLKSN